MISSDWQKPVTWNEPISLASERVKVCNYSPSCRAVQHVFKRNMNLRNITEMKVLAIDWSWRRNNPWMLETSRKTLKFGNPAVRTSNKYFQNKRFFDRWQFNIRVYAQSWPTLPTKVNRNLFRFVCLLWHLKGRLSHNACCLVQCKCHGRLRHGGLSLRAILALVRYGSKAEIRLRSAISTRFTTFTVASASTWQFDENLHLWHTHPSETLRRRRLTTTPSLCVCVGVMWGATQRHPLSKPAKFTHWTGEKKKTNRCRPKQNFQFLALDGRCCWSK